MVNSSPNRSIAVETYLGNALPNRIDVDPAPNIVALARTGLAGLLATVRQVAGPSGRYNCHGLVFASRRTNIAIELGSAGEVDKILRDDQFTHVAGDDAREGDVVVWRSASDIQHTGFVCRVDDRPPRTVFVWSMWGTLGEFVHPIHAVPGWYGDCRVEFWRLT